MFQMGWFNHQPPTRPGNHPLDLGRLTWPKRTPHGVVRNFGLCLEWTKHHRPQVAPVQPETFVFINGCFKLRWWTKSWKNIGNLLEITISIIHSKKMLGHQRGTRHMWLPSLLYRRLGTGFSYENSSEDTLSLDTFRWSFGHFKSIFFQGSFKGIHLKMLSNFSWNSWHYIQKYPIQQ